MSINVGTCGAFDYIIHEEHLAFLEFAASQGDRLLVFVVPDKVIERNKKRKPYYDIKTRCQNLEKEGYFAAPLPGLFDMEYILRLPLNVWVFGADQHTAFDLLLEERLRSKGVKIVRSPLERIVSTTDLLREIGYIS